MEWISILDSLPELNKEVLITDGTLYSVCELDICGNWKDIHYAVYYPTHWMLLPELQ